MHETLANFISSYGYIAVFLFVGLESLGIPLPGETALITAAALAGTGLGSVGGASGRPVSRSAMVSRHSSEISTRISEVAERLGSSRTLREFRQRHPQAWEFMVRRFEPGEYLGLHLTVGLIVSIAALWLFGGITEDVIHHDPLTQFDITLLEWFHAHNTATGLLIFRAISFLGSPLVMTSIGVLVAAILALHRRWFILVGWAAAFAGAGVLDTLLKHIIRRPRPLYAAGILHDYSFSFPSGHAMGSLVGYGMLAYLAVVFFAVDWKARLAVVLVASVLILSIGVSRLYLGVHYFSDVVGGYAAGILWLATCITGVEITRRQSQKDSVSLASNSPTDFSLTGGTAFLFDATGL